MKTTVKKALRVAGRMPGVDRLIWHGAAFLEGAATDYVSHDWQARNVFGQFTDEQGDEIPLVARLRQRIKPGWQAMLAPPAEPVMPDSAAVEARLNGWREKFSRVSEFLDCHGFGLDGRDVLEIGAYDGATACVLAEAGARNVIGIDMAAYYINQTADESVNRTSIERKNAELTALRDRYRAAIGDPRQCVDFVEDNVCNSALEGETQDIIFSWEVMEHVADPVSAFEQMYRLLRPGGLAFHEYNPFFSIDGGHSLCTLDFLWGHARLSDSDFSRYLDIHRPDEKALALSFFHNNLNRMTLAELHAAVNETGFRALEIMPWSRRNHLELLDRAALAQCTRLYPSVTAADMVSPIVWVLLQKPLN